jgi:hypothetical protein
MKTAEIPPSPARRTTPWLAVAAGAVYVGLLGAFVFRYLDPPEDEVWTWKGWILILVLLALLNCGLGFLLGRRTALVLAAIPLPFALIVADDSPARAGLFVAALAVSSALALAGHVVRDVVSRPHRTVIGALVGAVLVGLALVVVTTADPAAVQVRVVRSGGIPFDGAAAHLTLPSGETLDDQWEGHGGVYSLETTGPRAKPDDSGVARFVVIADWSTYGASCAGDREVTARLDESGWWRDRWREENGQLPQVTVDLGRCF